MQTKDGCKVLEAHKFESEASKHRIAAIVEINGVCTLLTYTVDGWYLSDKQSNDLDLINVPEPEYWSCPDDVPKDKPIWIRYKKSPHRLYLVGGITDRYISVGLGQALIDYADLHGYQYLNNGEWMECVK